MKDLQKRTLHLPKNKDLLQFLEQLKNSGTSVPHMFGFVKLHKAPFKIHPIVEKVRSPTYILEKNLARWCREKM